MNNTKEKETQPQKKTGTWPEVKGGIQEDADESDKTPTSEGNEPDK
jgi:hypothetical protein